MLVYKFGGASVKDAEGIRNLGKLVSGVKEELVVVVSAFGKTTNALEEVVDSCIKGAGVCDKIDSIMIFHSAIASELLGKNSAIGPGLVKSFAGLREIACITPPENYDYLYDQIVSLGEIWSTMIVNEWLVMSGVRSRWVDLREVLITDDRYRDANILWSETEKRISKAIDFEKSPVYVVQGFIGGTVSGESTTLGREGSDYTAAVIANILEADKVEIWKDVEGVKNADPVWMPDATSLARISYKEAVEMSYSGAKVIHPKTIKPLHNKNIPLYVRSFLNPSHPGTLISTNQNIVRETPVYVKKEKQVLLSLIPKDFSFVMGDNLGKVFHLFYRHSIKTNLVQASAISIAVCIDDDPVKIEGLTGELGRDFRILYNNNVELITVRQYEHGSLEKVAAGRTILVEQRTRRTMRLVIDCSPVT